MDTNDEKEYYDEYRIEYGFKDKTIETCFKIMAILAAAGSIVAFALIIKVILITDF